MKLYYTLKNISDRLKKLKDKADSCPPLAYISAQMASRLNTWVTTYAPDYVVAQGTVGSYGWWRKWNSGRAEYCNDIKVTANASSSYGKMYYVSGQTITYPTNLFNAAPIVHIHIERSGGLWFASIYNNTAASTTFYLASAKGNEGSVSIWYSVYADGTWK